MAVRGPVEQQYYCINGPFDGMFIQAKKRNLVMDPQLNPKMKGVTKFKEDPLDIVTIGTVDNHFMMFIERGNLIHIYRCTLRFYTKKIDGRMKKFSGRLAYKGAIPEKDFDKRDYGL